MNWWEMREKRVGHGTSVGGVGNRTRLLWSGVFKGHYSIKSFGLFGMVLRKRERQVLVAPQRALIMNQRKRMMVSAASVLLEIGRSLQLPHKVYGTAWSSHPSCNAQDNNPARNKIIVLRNL